MDEKFGRMVTRVVLPRVVMHSRHHYGVFIREHIIFAYKSGVVFIAFMFIMNWKLEIYK